MGSEQSAKVLELGLHQFYHGENVPFWEESVHHGFNGKIAY